MSMFKEASKHVAKSAGAKTLHPVTDLNSSEFYNVLSIVKRKTSIWFWKKPKYIPTQVTVKDILTKKLGVDESKFQTNVLLEQFVEKPNFKVCGDVGAKIASELNLDIDGSEDLSITVNLGNILKTRVNWQMLQEQLQCNSVNLNHRVIAEVQKKTRTTLCVVLESLTAEADGKLEQDIDEKVTTGDGVNVSKSSISVDVHIKGSVESKTVHSFSIPPKTVLAYSCNEFSIEKNGSIALHSTVDNFDSSTEFMMLREKEDIDSVDAVKLELSPLLKSESFQRLKVEFKLFSETATKESLECLHFLLSAAELYLEKKGEENTFKISTIKHLFNESGNQIWEKLLETLGFCLPKNFNDENSEILLPSEDADNLVKTTIAFFDALSDIEEASRKLLADIPNEHLKVMLDIVEKELMGVDVKLNDSQIKNTFAEQPSALLFLKNIGFIELCADDEELFSYSGQKSRSPLLDVYTVLYVFAN